MKIFSCYLVATCLLAFTHAQTTIAISTDKTTSLVFPFAIAHVDRGSESVLAQQVKEMSTILLVKAAGKNFAETNLSVVTNDGTLYTFLVKYDHNPAEWVYHLKPGQAASMASYANNIIDNPSTIFTIRDYSWNVVSRVKGIYVKDDILYYQLSIENKTPIDYSIDLVKFSILDKKKGKRTAIQVNELSPRYIAGNTTLVKANNRIEFVFAMNKFTIPDAKYLSVQIMESNGGRHLKMVIKNKNIMKAIPLPDLN